MLRPFLLIALTAGAGATCATISGASALCAVSTLASAFGTVVSQRIDDYSAATLDLKIVTVNVNCICFGGRIVSVGEGATVLDEHISDCQRGGVLLYEGSAVLDYEV